MMLIQLLMLSSACSLTTALAMCSNGTEWTACGIACTRTCDDREPLCGNDCIAKCECPTWKPFWNATTFQCMYEVECGGPAQSTPTCYYGQKWNPCGSPCEKTCDNPNPLCMAVCEEKCECPEKAPIFDNDWMRCISVEECGAGGTTQQLLGNGNWGRNHGDHDDGEEGPMNDGGDDGGMEWAVDGKCPSTMYGERCDHRCSTGCVDGTCDRYMGFCEHGCITDTQGAFCDQPCPKGCLGMYGCNTNHSGYCPDYQECVACGCQGGSCGYYSSGTTGLTPTLILMIVMLVTGAFCA